MTHSTETITIEQVSFSIVQVKDILDSLPKESWLSAKADELLDHTIFYHKGDVNLSFLCLGETPEWSLGYFIDGNVTVSRIIEATDHSSMGLIVSGDLVVDHMKAGGNDIYVAGDLQVNGLLLGKGNYGSLVVEGESYANAYIADDYAGWVEHRWGLTDDEYFEDEEISQSEYDEASAMILEAIRPEYLLKFDDIDEPFLWSHLLDSAALERAMKYHLPIFQDEFIQNMEGEFLSPVSNSISSAPSSDYLNQFIETIQQECSISTVEDLAKTVTGLAYEQTFVPKILYAPDYSVSVSFSEHYPERFFIDAVSVRSNYSGALPFGLTIGMTSDALKAQFSEQYTEAPLEGYSDSLQGMIEMEGLQIELLLENGRVTYINYQV